MRTQLPRQCAIRGWSLLPWVTPMVRMDFLIALVASTATANAQSWSAYDANTWTPRPESASGTRRSDPPRFVEIAGGAAHACALSDDGDVWCWGANNLGQAGQGTVGAVVRTPSRIASPRRYIAVAAGAMHTCAITTDHAVDCWGFDASGELGRGDLSIDCSAGPCSPEPQPVASLRRFDTVVAGHQHTCAISSGAAWCWGNNARGQLGIGDDGDRCAGEVCARAPRRVATRSSVVTMTAGGAHTCAAVADGSTWCWGDNRAGQLGIGQPQLERAVRPIRVATDYRFAQLASGATHTCGLATGGAVACWGDNDAGQLGAEFTNRSDVPLRESTRLAWRAVSAGARTTCGVTDAGETRCWGFGGGGRLGVAPPDSCGPGPCARRGTVVPGASRAIRVAVGGTFACALTTDVVRCWGGAETNVNALEDRRAMPQVE